MKYNTPDLSRKKSLNTTTKSRKSLNTTTRSRKSYQTTVKSNRSSQSFEFGTNMNDFINRMSTKTMKTNNTKISFNYTSMFTKISIYIFSLSGISF